MVDGASAAILGHEKNLESRRHGYEKHGFSQEYKNRFSFWLLQHHPMRFRLPTPKFLLPERKTVKDPVILVVCD